MTDPAKGLFITFEGGEGCGKSTQIKRLGDRLRATGREVLETREPGGTDLGEAIRQLLQHDDAGYGMTAEAELLLFAASRAQHVRERIAPALSRGVMILCDRFMDSTTAYQGVARAIDPDQVEAFNRFAVGPTLPHLTFLFDLSPELGLARIQDRSGGSLDRMEQEAIEFHQAVRQGYLDLAKANPDRFITLEASQTIESLEGEIWNHVAAHLG